jgi:hypothetical protein
VGASPAPGTQGVFATFDTTGNVTGIAMVCPFFTVAGWQTAEAKCTGSKPTGEQSAMPTPDVASVTDPPGVIGSLPGSGGGTPVTGAVIFPQVQPAVTIGSAVSVAEVSCSIPDVSLCPTVISDFEVREFPVPGATYQTTPGTNSGTATPASPIAPGPTTTRPAATTTPTTTHAAATTTPTTTHPVPTTTAAPSSTTPPKG